MGVVAGWQTEAQLSSFRKWTALALRVVVTLAIVFAMAGLQWLRPVEGMNVYFVLDRSNSIPSEQQDAARNLVNRLTARKQKGDRAGVIAFGTDASIDRLPNERIDLQRIEAVVDTERTDIAAAIRLGTSAFPETGQKRLVLMSDGNENIGDAMSAVMAARPLGRNGGRRPDSRRPDRRMDRGSGDWLATRHLHKFIGF